MQLIDLTGRKFGSRTVVGRAPNRGDDHTYWRVICDDCGAESIKDGWDLRQGKGCGACPRIRLSLEERFWAKVNKDGPIHPVLGTRCWSWTGSTDRRGYGRVAAGRGRSPLRASRVSWYLHHNEWPTLHVLHHCDNPPCVRPDHLFQGDDAANMRDASTKGRLRRAGNG